MNFKKASPSSFSIAEIVSASGLAQSGLKLETPLFSDKLAPFAGPGFMGFRGGVMNPSVLDLPDVGIVAVAKGSSCHWTKAKVFKASQYLKGSPLFFRFDSDLRVDSSISLEWKGWPEVGDFATEDFRVFGYQGRALVSHPVMKLERTTFSKTYRAARQVLSEVDVSKNELKFVALPTVDFELSPVEKNWIFYDSEKGLKAIYSVNPFRVLDLSSSKGYVFKTSFCEKFANDPLLSVKGISLSAGLTNYDEKHALLVVHKFWMISGFRVYVHWALLVDRVTLQPKYRTQSPLACGGGANGKFPGILYVMGAVARDSDVLFSVGESDSHAGLISIRRDKLDSEWVSVG